MTNYATPHCSGGILTDWHVITGAPCAGKTAVIDALARRGCRVVPEVARAFIDQQLSLGRSLTEIKTSVLAFERHILMAKVNTETRLPLNESIFLDRAIPDSIAYYQFEGLDPAEPIQHSGTFRYKTIFFMERLQFEADRVRSESAVTAAQIEALLWQSYRDLGYEPIRVPVMSVARRTDFILDCILKDTSSKA